MFGQVGINTTTPQAALEINSADSGVLLAPVNLSSSTDNTAVTNKQTAGSPAVATVVYNSGAGGLKDKGLMFWNGTSWTPLANSSIGDVKYSFQTQDHDGWYLLNGRTSASITNSTSRSTAVSLFGVNIPNAANTMAKGMASVGEVLGTNTGNTYNYTLIENNLPSFTLNPTMTAAGSHGHAGTTNNVSHNHELSDMGSSTNIINGGSTVGLNAQTGTRTIPTSSNGVHSHTLTTASGGAHSHNTTATYSNPSLQPIAIEPSSLVTNVFVFLGK